MKKHFKNLVVLIAMTLVTISSGCFANSKIINNTAISNVGPGAQGSIQNTSTTNTNLNVVNGNIINEDGTITHDGIRFKKGEYLGEFMLSGYCNCTKCSTGTGITYSGKPTRVNHTVGAKLKNIPLNTYLIVDNTHGKNVLSYDGVYQVEDTGSGVRDNHLDIFQANHDLAALVTYYGRTYADVYLAIPVEE